MIFLSILIFIVAIAIPSFKKNLTSTLLLRTSSLMFIFAAVLSFNALYFQQLGNGIGIYNGLFHINVVTQLIDTFLLILAALVLIPRPDQLDFQGGKYSLIVLFSTLGSILLISSADLLSMYLSIELQSFGVYILATLYRDSKLATSAGLKYFLLGGLSSCFILLGAGLTYTYTGLTNLDSIYTLVSTQTNINQGFMLGFIIMIIGFLFKIAAAPLHHWAPDVYDDSPTIVTIWLTIMPKIAIFIFLLDIVLGNSINTEIESIKNLLLISSLLSLIIGTVVGLAQNKIKRLLAYSTISHVGFLLLALSINTEQSVESFIFYIIQYSITNLNTFFIILALGYLINKTLDLKFISELKGQFLINPILSLSLAICLFSMAGIPPLIGFFSKQMVLYSSMQSGYYFMSIVAIIVSIISASYYLKIVRVLFSDTIENKSDNIDLPIITNAHSFIISTLTLTILLFILKPSILLNSTQLLSLTLYNC